jgi:hypothetical protein
MLVKPMWGLEMECRININLVFLVFRDSPRPGRMRTCRIFENNQLIGSVPAQWSTLTNVPTCAPHRPLPTSPLWLSESGSYHPSGDHTYITYLYGKFQAGLDS